MATTGLKPSFTTRSFGKTALGTDPTRMALANLAGNARALGGERRRQREVVAARSPAVIDGHQVGDQHEGVRQHAGEELQGRAGLLSTSSPPRDAPG